MSDEVTNDAVPQAVTDVVNAGPGNTATSRSALRRKLLAAVLVAAVGLGASAMSCVGQSFSLRQARAQEGIEQQLLLLRLQLQQGCSSTPKAPS